MEECHLLEFQNESLRERTNGQYVDTLARRMGVDAGEIAMIASQGSMRRMSSVSKVCVPTKITNSFCILHANVLEIVLAVSLNSLVHCIYLFLSE